MAHITIDLDSDGEVFYVYCSACDDGTVGDFQTWLFEADEDTAKDLLVDHLYGHGLRLTEVPELPYHFEPLT